MGESKIGYCPSCGEIVEKTDAKTCKAILKLCAIHDVNPRELVDVEAGRHVAIVDAYTGLPDAAKKTVRAMGVTLKKLPTTAADGGKTDKKTVAKKTTPKKPKKIVKK